jgi:spore coat polysaccharide biosynthesis protein SpsF (cytidylyltransferase family)
MKKFKYFAHCARKPSKEIQKTIHVTHCGPLVSLHDIYLIQHLWEKEFVNITKFIVSVAREEDVEGYKSVMDKVSHYRIEFVVRVDPSMESKSAAGKVTSFKC